LPGGEGTQTKRRKTKMKKTIQKFNEERAVEVFEYQLYGEYYCCKCGEPLFKCISIGEAEDEDGNDWRSFCKDDYEELKASGMTDEEIYDSFETNSIAMG
jgi:hypothetical protein